MNLTVKITDRINRYQLPLVFLLVVILTIVLYLPTLGNLVNLWFRFDESLGHGLLVLLVSGYLVYKAVDWKSSKQVNPAWHAVIPLLICSILWVMAYSVDINIIQQMLLPLIILASVYLLAGRNITLKILVPVLLLYFAIPVWDYLSGILLDITAGIVQTLVAQSDITAHIEGNSIFIPWGEIIIAHGCSGIRYFIIGLFLAVLSSYLFFKNNLVRLALVSMTVFLSLLANWVRVYAIIMIAYYSEMQSPLVDNHETLGWVVFMLFMLPLFYINYKYQTASETENDDDGSRRLNHRSSVIALLLFFPAIATGPVIAHVYEGYEYTGIIPVADSGPGQGNVVDPGESRESLWSPNIGAPAVERYTRIDIEGITIHHLVYGYKRTSQDRDILPYTSNIHNRDRWTVSQKNSLLLKSGNGSNKYRKLLLVNKYNSQQILLYYNYNVGGFRTDTYNIAKLLQIPATLSGNAYGLINFVWSECTDDCEKVAGIIESEIQGMIR